MQKLTGLSSALAIISATQAFGQAGEPFHLGTIFIGSDATNEIGIDNEDLTRTNPTDLQDVFATEPTVSVGSSLPISQKIYVNGVEENNLNVTIDGARQNNRIFHHSATTYIDPELLKAVRVDPGVAPADAGPAATAGAIAFETKDVDDLLDPGLTFGGTMSTEFRSNGGALTNSLALYGRSGNFDYLAFGKIANGGLQQDGNGDDIVGSETALTSGLGKIGFNGADGSRVELSFERVKDDAERPLRADFAGIGGGTDTRLWTLERQNIVLTYTGADTGGIWKPTAQLAFNATDLYTGPMPGSTDAYSGKAESLTGKLENEFAVANGTITAGVDFYSDVVDITGEGTAVYFAEEKATNVGAYAQARLDLSDRFRVTTGARYDFQRFEGLDGTTYDNSGFSANIAGDYDVSDTLTISAGASRVWGGIALAESFLMDPAWTYPADIEPVTSENFYLGANATLGAFDLNGKIFQTNIDNARNLYGGAATETFGADPGDTSDLDSKGFEIGATYNWSSGFARIAYANIESEIDGIDADSYTGRYLTTPLGDNLIIEVVHTFEDRALTIGADAQITFDRDGTYLGTPSGTLEGATVVNGFAEWKPQNIAGLTIRGEVNNLFDEHYTDRASYGQEFGSVTPLYEPGRSVSVLATYRF